MALSRDSIEPIDSDKKGKGGETKYWPLREILPYGLRSSETPFPQTLVWRSTFHFVLQNDDWSLNAYLNAIDFGGNALTIKIHREYSADCITTHAFADPKNSLADLFTVLIGIVGESGEVAVEKAKPLGKFGFEVYRLIDETELESILKSKAPYFFFVEIERKDITDKKQKAREKERKNDRCQRFENALRMCDVSLPDPISPSYAFLSAITSPVMFPCTSTSSATEEIPKYKSPPHLDPSLSELTASLPAGSPNISVPTSRYASPPATTTTVMFPSKSMSSATKEIPKTPPHLDPSPSEFTPSLPAGPPNLSVPISRHASRPATTTTVMFSSKSMSSATKEIPKTSPHLDPSLSELTPSLPAGPPNLSVPSSRYASRPATTTTVMFPLTISSIPSLPAGPPNLSVKISPNLSVQISPKLSVPISRYGSRTATTTTVMFPSKSMSSATKEIPKTPLHLDRSLSESTPSLPAGPPNISVPISRYASRPATTMAVIFPSKSMSSATKGIPKTPPHLDPSLSESTPSLPAGPPNISVPISRYASRPATTMAVMFPSKSMSSVTKEIPEYVPPPPLDPSISHPSLPARLPNPSLPTSNTSYSSSNLFEHTHKVLKAALSNYLERSHNRKLPVTEPSDALPPTVTTRESSSSIPISSVTKESSNDLTPSPLDPRLLKSSPSLPASAATSSPLTNGAESSEHDTLDPAVATLMKYYIPPTTTSGLFPPIRVSSDVIPETSPPLHPGLFKSPASLPARPPNPSLPTTTRKFQMDYRDLLLCGKGSDFTIIVKDMKFHAHKIILGARSSVFLAMTEPELSITDVDPAIFREFLLYLYTGYEEDIDWKNIAELYKLGDKYCVVDLKELCLERMKTSISMENFFEIFMFSQKPNNAELSEVTIQFFLENSKQIIESERYIGFMKDYPDEAYVLIKASVANK